METVTLAEVGSAAASGDTAGDSNCIPIYAQDIVRETVVTLFEQDIVRETHV